MNFTRVTNKKNKVDMIIYTMCGVHLGSIYIKFYVHNNNKIKNAFSAT